MDTAIAPAKAVIDLRYPESAGLIWKATRPGFYANLVTLPWHEQPIVTIKAFITSSSAFYPSEYQEKKITYSRFSDGKIIPCTAILGVGNSDCFQQMLLGPYDTPEEARAALKGYAWPVLVDYPRAVFEEPDGTTIPLGQWVNLPD